VASALEQPETAEVILIEDGSTDNSYALCQELVREDDRVCCYIHPEHQNRGAGASRNLGMRQAQHSLIAFLDADDFYLPGRFVQVVQVLSQNPAVDGVFEALGMHFYDNSKQSLMGNTLTTVRNLDLTRRSLFEHLIVGRAGYFSLDALVIRKRVLSQVGYFDESLWQTQDTDFIWRLALHANLQPGSLEEPVAMRGVHAHNGIFNRVSVNFYKRKIYHKWFLEMLKADWSRAVNWGFTVKKLEGEALYYGPGEQRTILRIVKLLLLPLLCIRYPRLLLKLGRP